MLQREHLRNGLQDFICSSDRWLVLKKTNNLFFSKPTHKKTSTPMSSTLPVLRPEQLLIIAKEHARNWSQDVRTCCVQIHGSRWSMNLWKVFAISEVDFAFAWSSLPLLIIAWQFLFGEFDGRALRTTDATPPIVYRGLLARVSGLSAAATLSSVFFVIFPVEQRDKRFAEGGFLGHVNMLSMLAHARVSFKEFEYAWDIVYHAEGPLWEVSLKAISGDSDHGFDQVYIHYQWHSEY